jgi:hypothetical protein
MGSKCLWPNLGCWLVWYVATMLICSISKYGEISDDFFLKIKQGKFLNCHIAYQSHMSISMFKPYTYACLWPIEFCQIVATLVRIFSCFYHRDHVHPHIHDNSYTGSYTKHAIHPPKINTPKSKEISLLVILQKQRGVIEKSICSRSIEKNVL